MPIYEYECTGCHHKFDVLQKINDEPVKKCPQCSKNKVQRLVSAAGFQLKGSGWYATDFKDKGKPSSNSDDKSALTDQTKSEHKTTESTTTESTTKKGETD